MDITQFQAVAPGAAAALALVALLTVLAALRSFRQARKDPTWRFRREARERGGRLLILGLFMLFMSVLIFSSTQMMGFIVARNITPIAVVLLEPSETPTILAIELPSETPTLIPTEAATATRTAPLTATPPPPPSETPTETLIVPTSAPLVTEPPTETITPSAMAIVTDTPDPVTVVNTTVADLPRATARTITALTETLQTAVVASGIVPDAAVTFTPSATSTRLLPPSYTPLPSRTPSVTSTVIDTRTVTPTLNPRQPTRLGSNVTPPADAAITITALDTAISGTFGPVNAATTFPAGFRRIYFFVTYSGMGPGMVWRGSLLRDGGVINRYERLWGSAIQGSAYFFFAEETGFPTGAYEIRLYFGDAAAPISTATFTVTAR